MSLRTHISERDVKAHLYHAQLALGQVGKLNLLDGHSLARAPVEGLIDGAESPLADAIAQSLSDAQQSTGQQAYIPHVFVVTRPEVWSSYVVLQPGILQSPLSGMPVPMAASAGHHDGSLGRGADIPPRCPCYGCSPSSMVRPLGVRSAGAHGWVRVTTERGAQSCRLSRTEEGGDKGIRTRGLF